VRRALARHSEFPVPRVLKFSGPHNGPVQVSGLSCVPVLPMCSIRNAPRLRPFFALLVAFVREKNAIFRCRQRDLLWSLFGDAQLKRWLRVPMPMSA